MALFVCTKAYSIPFNALVHGVVNPGFQVSRLLCTCMEKDQMDIVYHEEVGCDGVDRSCLAHNQIQK